MRKMCALIIVLAVVSWDISAGPTAENPAWNIREALRSYVVAVVDKVGQSLEEMIRAEEVLRGRYNVISAKSTGAEGSCLNPEEKGEQCPVNETGGQAEPWGDAIGGQAEPWGDAIGGQAEPWG